MSSILFYDSDDERDSFDTERQEVESFRNKFLSASIESSEDDDEGIIDGTKIPSSTKVKSRARHSFLDISTLSSSSSYNDERSTNENDNDIEANPFDIISKSIDIESNKSIKKKKSLGVSKSKIQLDTLDIYDQDDSSHSRNSLTNESDNNNISEDLSSNKAMSNKKSRIRKPTKATILETERKMQQLSRTERLVLPTFVPKPLETWHAIEKRSRQELMNEIRAKNPSFTPQDPELPEFPVVNIESTVVSTLAELTKLIEDKPPAPTNSLSKLSRFLNPDILNKKPKMSTTNKESTTMIDLTDTKKPSTHPTVKSTIHISLDCIKSPSSSKRLFDMQKQLGIRMQAKRAAMLAEQAVNIQSDDDDNDDGNDHENEDEQESDDDSVDSTKESNDTNLETITNTNKENDVLRIDEETRQSMTDDEDNREGEIEEFQEDEDKENTNPSSDPNRPSLKTILTRLESTNDSIQVQPAEQNSRTEWFNASRPVQFDSELEMLCSGAFGGDNIIPVSQNNKNAEPLTFSPLPITQLDDEEPDMELRRSKVRQLIDDDDDDDNNEKDSNKQSGSSNNNGDEEEEEEENMDDGEEQEGDLDENEELIDYKKQLFEMEAEESGSEIDEKEKEDESDPDDSEEPDEELQKFIDTAAIEIDEEEADDLAKVHLKIKAKEDEQQLKLLKEQYLDFDADDDGRRLKISKAPNGDDEEDEDDPDYNSEVAEDEEDDDDDDEDDVDDAVNFKDRMSELERQRSIQDNQAEELHLDEDLGNIGQHSSMFQKGLALKQKRLQSTITINPESTTQTTVESNVKKSNQTRSVTLSSVLLAKRFSSTLLAPMNRNNVTVTGMANADETTIKTKKQHNPRRHVFSTHVTAANANENQNPTPATTSSGEKRSNSDKSPKANIKRFKQSTTIATTSKKPNESSTSVFSALASSNVRR